MLEKFKKEFSYTKLTEEDIQKRGILGRLVGPIADTINPTRNSRKYNLSLWENVFNDPIMQEKINNRCLFMELGHPADRTEIDMEKVCACLAETPKVGEDGLLYGVVDILPTANGKILKALCDYGTNVGISSRGTGDIMENNEVDPDTYDCETFDIVIVPAVECARLTPVNESLDKNVMNLKKALCESLNGATEEEKKVMEETLDNLNIKLTEEEEVKKEPIPEKEECITCKECADKEDAESEVAKEVVEEDKEATNDGSDELIKNLQETLTEKAELETNVQSLQEQLAVANDKVNKVNEELGKYKEALARVSTKTSKVDSERISSLEEELKAKEQTIESLKSRVNSLVESKKADVLGAKSLNESISKKDLEIKTLNENFDEIKSKYESDIKSLNESIETLKSDSESKEKEYCESLKKETTIKENYKKIANNVVNRYIESKATVLGINPNEIKNKLPESYTIDDIDSICEELQSYELNISKLPFSVDRKVNVKVRESKQDMIPNNNGIDEDVDDSLFRLANLK